MIEIERYTFLGTWLTHYTVDLEKKVKCSNENTKMRCSPENVYAFGTGMLDIHTEIFQVIWQFDVSRRDERLLHGPTTFTKTHTHTHTEYYKFNPTNLRMQFMNKALFIEMIQKRHEREKAFRFLVCFFF